MGIPERKEREKEQRRNDIIDAAERVFFRKGIANSTMDEVAEEAELSKGTLYLYFLSKEDLHFAICMRGLDIMAAELRKAFRDDITGAENAMETAEVYLRFVRKYHAYFDAIMSFESSGLDKVNPVHHHQILQPESPLMVFVRVIEKGGRDGTIRQDIPPKELAVILWSQINGVLQFLRHKSDFLDMLGCTADDMVTHHLQIIRNGIIRNTQRDGHSE
jgi:AcrR family transcriptional regulator